MQTYEPSAGTSIDIACREAVTLAAKGGEPVRFTFNDVALQAMPTDRPQVLAARWWTIVDDRRRAYENSPEGRAAARQREIEITDKQASLDGLVARLPALLDKNNLDEVVRWVRDIQEPADDVGTKWNPLGVAAQLEAAGYVENEYVGQKPEWFNTRERMGRYIIGQAINCMKRGMPPHGITNKFVDEYFALPVASTRQDREAATTTTVS